VTSADHIGDKKVKATLKVLAAAALLAVARTPSFAGDLDAALLIGASTLTSASGNDTLSQAVEAAGDVLDLD
jgi:hypothetical protein